MKIWETYNVACSLMFGRKKILKEDPFEEEEEGGDEGRKKKVFIEFGKKEKKKDMETLGKMITGNVTSTRLFCKKKKNFFCLREQPRKYRITNKISG